MPSEPTPLSTPWSLNPSPEVLDDLVVEIVDSENAPGTYVREPVGLPAQDQNKYPGYIFLGQKTLSNSKVQRFWSTPGFSNQDIYNYEQDYVAESTDHPIYIRRYKVRRDQYNPTAGLALLTGLWRITVTNAGSGYDPDQPPAVTIGGPGTGATAVALVNPDGTIGWIRITAEGTGYTSAPVITIAAPSSGVQATATSKVQGSSCYLVSQKTSQFPEDDPRFSLFIIETRAYKTLPGPIIPSRGFRPDGTMILSTKQDVFVTDQPTGGAGTLGDTVQGINSIEAQRALEQLVEDDGVTNITEDVGYILYETEPRTNSLVGTILRVRPYEEALPAPGDAAPVGSGYITHAAVKEIPNSRNVIQIITIKPLPGYVIPSLVLRVDGNLERETRQQVLVGTVPTGGDGVISDQVQAIDTVEATQIIKQLVEADGTTPITEDAGFMLLDTDQETNADIGIIFRLRPYGETLPAIGATLGAGAVIHRRIKEIEGSTNVIQIITTMALPEPWVEFVEVVVTYPGIFKFATWAASNNGLKFMPPWPGDGVSTGTYYQSKPRSERATGRLVHSYSWGSSGTLPQRFTVYTPGTASKVFSIPNDTVHGPIVITEVDSEDSETYTVENIDASMPAGYNARQILTIGAEEKRQRGKGLLYEREVIQVSEATPVSQFGTVLASKTFSATAGVDLLGQPNPGGDRLWAFSTNAGDTSQSVTIYGSRNNADGQREVEETLDLDGVNRIGTSATYDWFTVTQFALSATATGTVSLRGSGTFATGTITASGVMADGDSIEAGRLGSTITYTARNPLRATIAPPVGGGASLVTGAAPGSFVRIVFAGGDDYFWFSNGTTTDPAPGGTGHAVVFTGGDTQTQLNTALSNAIQSALSAVINRQNQVTSIILTGIVLGDGTITQDAGNDFTITVTAAGTAQAPFQIRTGWAINGSAFAAIDTLVPFERAVNLTGTAGQDYGSGTTIHPDLTVEAATDSQTRNVSSKIPYSAGVWVFTEASSVLTTTGIADGSDGPLIAQLAPGELTAWNDISFDNTPLVLTASGWTEDQVDPYGAIVYNVPANAGVITTDALALPTSLTGRTMILRMIAGRTPAMPIYYQFSPNGTTGWVNGATALDPIGGRVLYDVRLAETISSATAFIRMVMTQTIDRPRPTHLEIFYPLI